MRKIFLFAFVLCLSVIVLACSHTHGGMTTSGGTGSGGTVTTGTAAPSGTTGTGSTRVPGEVVPKEQKSSDTSAGILTDARLADAVKQKLQAFPSADQIQVVTQDGIVTLSGPVADQTTADSIVKAVREVKGVKDVKSQLSVQSQ